MVNSEADSEDAADESAMDDENRIVESYDSALERIAVASTSDPGTPEGPLSPSFQPADKSRHIALRQLNLWDTGLSSLDLLLLENTDPEEFTTHVAQIAQTQGFSPDSENVEQVLSALMPYVEANKSNAAQKSNEIESKGEKDVMVGNENSGADPEVVRQCVSSMRMGDAQQNDEEEMNKISSSHAEPNGFDAGDEFSKLDARPLEPCQPKEGMNMDLTNADFTAFPESTAYHASALETFQKSVANLCKETFEDIAANDMTERQSVGKDANLDSEAEMIEWGDMNEFNIDHVGNGNPPEDKGAKETEKLGTIAYTDQEIEVGDGPWRSMKEVIEGADLTPYRAKFDSVEVPSSEKCETVQTAGQVEGMDVFESISHNPEVGEEISGNEAMESVRVTDMEETNDSSSDTKPKADNTLPVKVASKEDANTTPEDGKTEFSESRAAKVGKARAFQGEISDVTAVIEGLHTNKEPTEAPIQVEHYKSLEREVSQDQHDLLKHDELVASSALTDSHVRTEATPVVTGPSDFTCAVEERRQLDATVSDKESKHTLSNVATDGHTSVGNDKISPSSENDSIPSLGAAGPSLPIWPAGLGRSIPLLERSPLAVQRRSGALGSSRQASESNEGSQASADIFEGREDAHKKLQMIRVKFLRLAHRLDQSAHNVVVAQVLYRLGLAEQLRGGRGTGRSGTFGFEKASILAEEQEAAGVDDLEFGCTIMVLGKSGVGKSATINSLFDEMKSGTNAYSPATDKVQEVVGTVHGIKLRVIDTPGLLTSFTDLRRNERIMSSVKRFIKKSPPDIVLYFDRLDMQSRDYSDLPLLRTITDTLGSAVWFNAIIVLTHASSAPPDGANGVPVSYEMFIAQRSHVLQQAIRQACGDMRLMNPISLVENHNACRRNRAGECVLPNGQVWKPQLLLLCFASKILAEANSLLKLQDSSLAKPFGVRTRAPPLPFLLSSLLQSMAQLKLPDEQNGTDDDESEDDSDDEAESDGEEYDDLPPFRRLTRDELKLLDLEQRRTYIEELEYREKLFLKKQLKEERARKKELKSRLGALPKEVVLNTDKCFEEGSDSASPVPVPLPDMALPPSFDTENPTYRYRYLDTSNQWLVRPVLESHGWDHDSGYDGVNFEKMFIVSKKIPASISVQVTKDKKEANLQMECMASLKNGKGKSIQAGLDMHTVGKDLAYTLRSEMRFDNFKRNKTACGLAITLLGDTVAAGMKVEDCLSLGKQVKLVFNGGALTGGGDLAYGGSVEATIRDKEHPIGHFLSTFGLSVMDWHGDLAIGGNLQVQCKFGKMMTVVRGNLNNRKAGQVSIRVSSSEQLQMAFIGLIPLLRTFIKNIIHPN